MATAFWFADLYRETGVLGQGPVGASKFFLRITLTHQVCGGEEANSNVEHSSGSDVAQAEQYDVVSDARSIGGWAPCPYAIQPYNSGKTSYIDYYQKIIINT